MDVSFQALVKQHASLLEYDAAAKRVRCVMTGHSMPAVLGTVERYVKGKKFAALCKKAEEMKALKQYEPHIVPSKYHTDKLFCRITGRLVTMKEEAVVQHSSGKRFQICFAYAEAGRPLKDEQPPKAEADAGDEDGDEDGGPSPWVPPQHVLDSESDPDEEGGEDEVEEDDDDDDDAGAFEDDDDEMEEPEEEIEVVRPPKRKADAEPRLKKLHKHVTKAKRTAAVKRLK